MLGSWQHHELPNLAEDNCELTSPATTHYNCIAWAAQDASRWWWPDAFGLYYWPKPPVPREETMNAFVEAYKTIGFAICLNGSLEAGLEKLAIYGVMQSGDVKPTHAALQLSTGRWTSKLGLCEDITHTSVDDVNGPVYGRPYIFMQRTRG